MHQWDVPRAATTFSVSQPQGQVELTEFQMHKPLKFSGKIRPQPLKPYVRHQHLKARTTSPQLVRSNKRHIDVFSVVDRILLECVSGT